VHITSLNTGSQWYSGERNTLAGSPAYVYKDRGDAERYAALMNRSEHLLADVEEYEIPTEENEDG